MGGEGEMMGGGGVVGLRRWEGDQIVGGNNSIHILYVCLCYVH